MPALIIGTSFSSLDILFPTINPTAKIEAATKMRPMVISSAPQFTFMSYPPLALSLSHKLVLLEAKRSPKKRPKPINDNFLR
ncbi:MAG: hypothetical protein E3J56_04225 [Candidatus Aminicenantes bacterium]|nr:MAG: hypothetical protein E3J56_04225 [Candidatus Aminicenantes bacterium]